VQAARPSAELDAARTLVPAVFIASLGADTHAEALALARKLRRLGVRVELDGGRSLKSLMRRADRLGAPRVLILGEEEVAVRRGTLRHMTEQRDEKHAVDFDLEGSALLEAVGVGR
jgi:histidyl-tRNA synthetase